jgi:Glycosyltransferase family 10 (fucosyltransferase) C-term
MISIVALININEWLQDEGSHIHANIEDSMYSVVKQTYKKWELRIVLYGNNKTDCNVLDNLKLYETKYNAEFDTESGSEKDEYKIRIVYFPDTNTYNESLQKVVNEKCIYSYIALLDLTDIWEPNKLELQVAKLTEFKRIEVLGSKSIYNDKASNIPVGELYNYNLFKVNPFINSTVIFKRGVLKYFENCDTLAGCEFNALWLQLAIHQDILYNIPDITIKHTSPLSLEKYNNCYEMDEFKTIVENIKRKYVRIKFFSDYCTSSRCKHEYERTGLYNLVDYYGKNKKLYFTTTETYTHAILLNCPVPPNLQVEKQNVVGFAQEPPDNSFLRLNHNNFIQYAVQHIGRYFIGSVGNLPATTFIGHHGFLFHETPPPINMLIPSHQKPKLMSIMVSFKKNTVGHIYRHALVAHILKYKWPIDIWGNGVDEYKKKNSIGMGIAMGIAMGGSSGTDINSKYLKGGFNSMSEMCKEYAFTIAIENTSHDHYFSEKLINPLLYNTIPIYWGCKKVNEYFPKQVIRLTGNINSDIILIHRVLRNPQYYMNEYKINRDAVLDKVNLITNIDKIFDI